MSRTITYLIQHALRAAARTLIKGIIDDVVVAWVPIPSDPNPPAPCSSIGQFRAKARALVKPIPHAGHMEYG